MPSGFSRLCLPSGFSGGDAALSQSKLQFTSDGLWVATSQANSCEGLDTPDSVTVAAASFFAECQVNDPSYGPGSSFTSLPAGKSLTAAATLQSLPDVVVAMFAGSGCTGQTTSIYKPAGHCESNNDATNPSSTLLLASASPNSIVSVLSFDKSATCAGQPAATQELPSDQCVAATKDQPALMASSTQSPEWAKRWDLVAIAAAKKGSSVPHWITITALAVGVLLLLGGGFLVFKAMNGGKQQGASAAASVTDDRRAALLHHELKPRNNV